MVAARDQGGRSPVQAGRLLCRRTTRTAPSSTGTSGSNRSTDPPSPGAVTRRPIALRRREEPVARTTCAWMAVGMALAIGSGTAAAQDLFDLQKVADGVYAALAKPRTPINCNAAVIVYDEGV